jgi:CheY-like chemotaxis protein
MAKKIVIVDDSKLGSILVEILRRDKNYEAVLYTTGRDAIINMGESSCFDLAVVDVGLPDMAGENVIEYLRNKYPSKSVICISSYRGHQSPQALRTIHKGSVSKLRQLVDILEESCSESSVQEKDKRLGYSNYFVKNDP